MVDSFPQGCSQRGSLFFLCCVVYVLYICETCLIVRCAKQFDDGDGDYEDVVAKISISIKRTAVRASLTVVIHTEKLKLVLTKRCSHRRLHTAMVARVTSGHPH